MDEEPYINDDLKPCPFCGGEADVSQGSQGPDQRPWWYVECIKCAATCESVEAWNARVFECGPHIQYNERNSE